MRTSFRVEIPTSYLNLDNIKDSLVEDTSSNVENIFAWFNFKFRCALFISDLRIFWILTYEKFSALAEAFCDLEEFLFWPPSKIFQEKFRLIVFV